MYFVRAVLLLALLAALPLGAQDFPFPPEPPPPVTIGRLYRNGVNHLRNDRPEQAREAWQALLRRSPYHFNAHLALGKLLIDRDPAAAGRHLDIARDLRPASDAVHYHLGRYLESQERLLDAAEEFRQAIRLNARHYSANTRLREIIRTLRRRQSMVERAAETFWSNPSLASLTLFGKIVMLESEPRQALMEFELVRQRASGLPEVNLWIARAQRQLDDSRQRIPKRFQEHHRGGLELVGWREARRRRDKVGIPLQFVVHEGDTRVAGEHVLYGDSKEQPILVEPLRPKGSHVSRIGHECIAKNRRHRGEVSRNVPLD